MDTANSAARKEKVDRTKVVIHLFLIVAVLLICFPLYYAFVLSTQSMEEVISGLAPALSVKHLIISVAAGISTDFISRHFKENIPVIRIMPNTPALIQEGASALSRGKFETESHLRMAQSYFRCRGESGHHR